MNITIKKSRDADKIKPIWLPMDEDKLEEISNELGVEMTTDPNVYIEGSMDRKKLCNSRKVKKVYISCIYLC